MARCGADLEMAKLLSFKLYFSRFWGPLLMTQGYVLDHVSPFFLENEFALLDEDKDYSQSKTHYSQSKTCVSSSWNVSFIEFGDSYQAPLEETGKGLASESSAKKRGKTVAITTEDMQKRKNDVKARTTLLLALPDEYQLRFIKYETAQELWGAIVEGLETLEQTFNKLQAIVSHLEFMDVEIEQDDLNQKFLTCLAPEWLMYTVVWRNRDDVDTMSLDDVYNHLKIKYEDITQIDEDDIEEIDIKWNMALLSMRADRAPRSQDRGKRESYRQGPKEEEHAPKDLMAIDGIGWDWSYMANEEENHALVADEKVPTEFALMVKSSSSSENKVEARLVEFKTQEIMFCKKIRGLERDVEVRNNKIENLMNELEQDIMLYPPPAQVYSPPKKDMSWTGLPEFADDTVTDYSRPTPSIDSSKSNTSDLQNSNPSVSEHGESSSSIMSKPMIKFVKATDCPGVIKTNKTETTRKSPVKYAEMYRNTSKSHKEVIEFGDSYQAPLEETGKGLASKSSTKKKEKTVAITTEDMQKRKNDVKARTTLLLALLDEHQLRFIKYETAQELWGAILKTFGLETLEQTFNRLQAIVSHLEFMDVEIEQDDLNQKFLTSLAPEWLIGKGEVHTSSVSTVSTARTDVAAASISHDTVCAFIASQSNGSQIKYEDITQIDEDDIEEMDIKWNMALLSMRADRAPRSQDRDKRESYRQGPKEEEHAPKDLMAIDGIGWDWSYMANEEENHALVADEKIPTEFARMAKSSSSSENEVKARLVEFKTQEIMFCEKIRGLERDVEVRNNKIENLMNELEQVKKEKEGLDNKLTGFGSASKDLDTLLGSQRTNKNKEGLPKFADDTVTDYSRPTPSIDSSKSNTSDLQNSNLSVSEHGESSSSIMSKPMIKFVKATDCLGVIKTNKTETARKSPVKYAEMYRNTSKSPKVRDGKEKLKHENFSMRPEEETSRSPPSEQTNPMNNNVMEGTYTN
nr:hypothetical protein [Tanacetum cinerariifolium]